MQGKDADLQSLKRRLLLFLSTEFNPINELTTGLKEMKQLSPVYIVFWICVFLHTTKKKYTIAIYSDIACMLTKISDDEAIIYLRFYTNMQEAVGHKLFLENLDNYTLLINIKCMNPHLRNLRPLCEALFQQN